MKAETHVETCFDYIDTFANDYFTSDYFLNIKLATLDSLLRRDTLDYSEVKLFKAVINWVDHKCIQQDLEVSYENRRKILGNVIYNIRFLVMTLDEFITNVMAVDILNDHESIGIIKAITGHHVTDLKWNNLHVRRQSTSKDWWNYAAVILFLSAFICLSYCLSLKFQPYRNKQNEKNTNLTTETPMGKKDTQYRFKTKFKGKSVRMRRSPEYQEFDTWSNVESSTYFPTKREQPPDW